MKFAYEDTATVASEEIEEKGAHLNDYRQHLQSVATKGGYTEPECSINLPFDSSILERVQGVAQKKRRNGLKYIVVVGIGGSNLGTKAIYDARYGYFDAVEPDRHPQILFLDTNDAEYLKRSFSFLSRVVGHEEEIIVNAISKSGGTTETIANTEFLIAALRETFPDIEERLVVTTNENSALAHAAEKKNITYLSIPPLVGGRYSVLSSVGLFPLLLAGVNVDELLRGAREMQAECLKEPHENPALLSAIVLKKNHEAGKTINNNFIFNSELESLGKWYRQLMGESIGKEHNTSGERVHTGIIPIVSIGSTDLHSVGQLYLGGPRDVFTTFIKSPQSTLEVPQERVFSDLATMIDGKSAQDIMNAILEGVKAAYTKNELPYAEIEFEEINEYELGQFLQFKMMEMMYLGKLFDVNTFDQPNVESYKEETRKILET